jgi:hypothetical protein
MRVLRFVSLQHLKFTYNEFRTMFPTIKVTCFVRKPVRIAELANIIRKELAEQDQKH